MITIQNPKPQTCQQSCHSPLTRLLSVAEGMIALLKINIHPFSNEFERSEYLFSWGSE